MKKPLVFTLFLALAACGDTPSSDGAQAPAAAASAATAAAAPATPEERGRKLFSECAVCHTVKQGDANRIGPNLFGVTGATAGQVEGFAYSKAMKDSGIVWTDETLDAFIANPPAYLRGNRMAYAGQRDAQRRADIIAYMKTLK